VSDKRHLDVLAQLLIDHRVEVLSTGGTAKALAELGVPVVKVSDFTGAPEILGGRVKTLHPRIHGGILALPTAAHEEEARLHDIPPIDLVVVNLYPFRETIAQPHCRFEDAIENIDIGGPTMVRAAAKNWGRVAIVVDPADYAPLAAALRESPEGLPDGVRRRLSRKAFAHTAAYDAAIAEYLARHDDEGHAVDAAEIAASLFVTGEATLDLRYGENPHQVARFVHTSYAASEAPGIDRAAVLQGKALSYNNLLDADAAIALIRDLAPLGPAAAVFKHVSPCGAALGRPGEPLADVFVRAREADAESAFGGIVSLTHPIDRATAERLVETFLEVVIAPAVDDDALAVLATKKALRVLALPGLVAAHAGPPPLRLRSVAGGLLVQREDTIDVRAAAAKVVTRRSPTAQELLDLELAQVLAKHVRSNAIVLVRDGASVGIGGGQTSRVEAARQACTRARERAQGAALGSDAFFPFRDGLDVVAGVGVRAVIQPGGSVRDDEVIAAADEHDLAMVFSGQRHFRH
jgi:phosphoribosylaminoimidazolecarboxamide formyltransferase/IMP cyclohydrolase